jgi:hypothetical protein
MRASSVVKVTFAAGVVLLGAVVALTLMHAPPRVLRSTPSAQTEFTRIDGDGEICQAGESLPAGATAIRFALPAFFGARVSVTAFSGSHVLTQGTRNPDWTGSSVTVPIKPLARSSSHVRLCFTLGPNSEPLDIVGFVTPRREMAVWHDGRPVGGRLGVEVLGNGQGSWWSRILEVARHMGLGHALTGTWVVLLIAGLMAATGVLAVRLALREMP